MAIIRGLFIQVPDSNTLRGPARQAEDAPPLSGGRRIPRHSIKDTPTGRARGTVCKSVPIKTNARTCWGFGCHSRPGGFVRGCSFWGCGLIWWHWIRSRQIVDYSCNPMGFTAHKCAFFWGQLNFEHSQFLRALKNVEGWGSARFGERAIICNPYGASPLSPHLRSLYCYPLGTVECS